MSYDRRAYDDADTTGQMTLDARACAERVPMPSRRRLSAADVVRPAPRLDFAVTGREVRKRDIELDEAAAHLAARLRLA